MAKSKKEVLADMKEEMRTAASEAGVKGIFFGKMPGEWQSRYKRLKYEIDHEGKGEVMANDDGSDLAKPVQVAPPVESDKKPFNTDKITLDKSELELMFEKIEKLEAQLAQGPKKNNVFSDKWEPDTDKSGPLKATLRRKDVDGKAYYATDLKFSRKEFNEKLREMQLIYNVGWSGADGDITEEMPLPEFMGFDREQVLIVNQQVKKLKKVSGSTTLTKVEYDKFKSKGLGTVPMQVTAEEISFDVELPDGRILKNFPSAGLNR